MISQETRDSKIESLSGAYPSLALVSGENPQSLVWEGWLQPLIQINEFNEILCDLEADREIQIVRGESYGLVHHSKCKIAHPLHPLTKEVVRPTRLFKVRLIDYCDGRQPLMTILEPAVPIEQRRHVWGEDGICGYAPHKHRWHATESSIVEFVDHSLIWLFKWNVFSQTTVWIGGEENHNRRLLFESIRASDPCYCGSRNNYEHCHRFEDGARCFGKNWLFFEIWWTKHNENLKRFNFIINNISRKNSKATAATTAR